MAGLSLKNICKVYPNGFQAVKDFNLEIADQEFIIFVGPSGCGKSTTLRMIAGLEDITSGELKIGDKVVNDVEPKDRDIAMVFQNYALYPHMTVYDNMAFGLKLRKVPKNEIDRMVKEAEANAAEDKAKKEDAEAKNNANSLIGSAERIVKDFEGKVDKADEEKLNEQKDALKKALEENKPVDEIKKLSEELQQTMFSISQKAYEAVQKEDAANSANTESSTSSANEETSKSNGDDDVIDAEFTKE